jgi:hypothetical protein
MALPAHTIATYGGVQGPKGYELLNESPIVEPFRTNPANANTAFNVSRNIVKKMSPKNVRIENGKMTMQCVVIYKRQGTFRTMKRDITITQLPRNKIKLFTGEDQAAIVSCMHPEMVEERPGSKVVWVKPAHIQKDVFGYIAYSPKLKLLVCVSEDIMCPGGNRFSRAGTLLLASFMTTIRDGAHVAYKVKLKTRGDTKVNKSPVKISPKVGRFMFCSSLSRFFNERR